jgi:hypothetical protein
MCSFLVLEPNQLRASYPLNLTTPALMAQRAQNAQANAGGEESLLSTVWSIGQKMFLAWAISQLGMQ